MFVEALLIRLILARLLWVSVILSLVASGIPTEDVATSQLTERYNVALACVFWSVTVKRVPGTCDDIVARSEGLMRDFIVAAVDVAVKSML